MLAFAPGRMARASPLSNAAHVTARDDPTDPGLFVQPRSFRTPQPAFPGPGTIDRLVASAPKTASRVALIGFGAIARLVAEQLEEITSARLAGVLVRPRHLAAARKALPRSVAVVTSVGELRELSAALIVECAGQSAVAEYGEPVVAGGTDLMVISSGALADHGLRERLVASAGATGARILVPVGAIAGIDGLNALRLGGLDHVRYTSIKPPIAWKGTPAEDAVDLDALSQAAEVFAGPADAAARRFPKNANIAATVALAGLGFERTEVHLVADPGVVENIGRIEAGGRVGTLELELRGPPDPDNPKTSTVTAFSILHAIANRSATLVV
jgi:aspartate dehydrogenase